MYVCMYVYVCSYVATLYRESFVKENFYNMSIVSVREKTFANLVINTT